MVEKVEYYLKHEGEREKIAKNGREKIIEKYDYSVAWNKIFNIVFM